MCHRHSQSWNHAAILNCGTPTQRKALVEQLVAEIQIVGPSQLRPIYRIRRANKADTEPSLGEEPMLRAMGNLVGATGIEPVTARV